MVFLVCIEKKVIDFRVHVVLFCFDLMFMLLRFVFLTRVVVLLSPFSTRRVDAINAEVFHGGAAAHKLSRF